MVSIRQESAADFKAVYEVNLRAFGRKAEAELVKKLRGADGLFLIFPWWPRKTGRLKGICFLQRCM